jgi:hypothetical protein
MAGGLQKFSRVLLDFPGYHEEAFFLHPGIFEEITGLQARDIQI